MIKTCILFSKDKWWLLTWMICLPVRRLVIERKYFGNRCRKIKVLVWPIDQWSKLCMRLFIDQWWIITYQMGSLVDLLTINWSYFKKISLTINAEEAVVTEVFEWAVYWVASPILCGPWTHCVETEGVAPVGVWHPCRSVWPGGPVDEFQEYGRYGVTDL